MQDQQIGQPRTKFVLRALIAGLAQFVLQVAEQTDMLLCFSGALLGAAPSKGLVQLTHRCAQRCTSDLTSLRFDTDLCLQI